MRDRDRVRVRDRDRDRDRVRVRDKGRVRVRVRVSARSIGRTWPSSSTSRFSGLRSRYLLGLGLAEI